jgi:hypothetical protein
MHRAVYNKDDGLHQEWSPDDSILARPNSGAPPNDFTEST